MNRQSGNVHEFENLEELRRFDLTYNEASNNAIMKSISEIFKCTEDSIQNIEPIKLGMTNHSFTFTHDDVKYIMRIPGEGTDVTVNREEEYHVYQLISPHNLSDDLIYIDPKTGYKITKYLENARICDLYNFSEVQACMKKLREFHDLKLKVDHTFDVFERMDYYESLWLTKTSCFRDYAETKANILKLRSFVETAPKEWSLTHIDSIPSNFLIEETDGKQRVRLIDWEYASMQDPHLDLGMFIVNTMYDHEHADKLIDCYFTEGCPDVIRLKIYAYVAMIGLLWSNWCEYKSHMGIEFGEFSLGQYRMAKDYYRIFTEKQEEIRK